MIWAAVKFIGAFSVSAFMTYMAHYWFDRSDYIMAAIYLVVAVGWMFAAIRLFRKLDEVMSQ